MVGQYLKKNGVFKMEITHSNKSSRADSIKEFITKAEQNCKERKKKLSAFRIEAFADNTAYQLNIAQFTVDVSVDGNGRDSLILSLLKDIKHFYISGVIGDSFLTPKDLGLKLY